MSKTVEKEEIDFADMVDKAERMKIIMINVKSFRRTFAPDWNSVRQLDNLIQQLIDDGAREAEVRYAIKVVYSKRIKKYEDKNQLRIER
jgi:hypothetical protein